MLGWSINLFRVRGIQLAIHWSFFVLLALVGYEAWREAGWLELAWTVGTLLAFFGCVVLHELGHSFTAMHYGIGVRRILLMPIGGMAEFEEIPRQPARELLITLAGPAVNFVIAGLLWAAIGFGGGFDYRANATGLAQALIHANLFMGTLNLLPIFPMDGGRILRASLAWRMPYLRATFVASRIGKVLAIIAVGVVLFGPWIQPWQNRILPAILFTFIGVVGELEYRAVRQRELEVDAHWHATLARLYGRPASEADEPPILLR